MTNTGSQVASPAKGIWKRFIVLIPLALVLVFASRAYIGTVISSYTAESILTYSKQDFERGKLVIADPNVVEPTTVELTDRGTVRVTFHALRDGETEASFSVDSNEDWWVLTVKDGALFEGNINFSGWETVQISLFIFFAVTAALFMSIVHVLRRQSWYGYEMVASGGAFLFFLLQCISYIIFCTLGGMRDFVDLIVYLNSMADLFVFVSLIPLSIMAILVSISNIVLIRREGMRPVNLLGIAVSVIWAISNFICFNAAWWLYQTFESVQVAQFINSLLVTAISFGECLLLSVIVCAWAASRHVPQHELDYLVILGCGIRPDGTPSPLLAGRVDKALVFNSTRMAAGDASVTFVPSGGQGPDECMSEAQSMCNYLSAKGVDKDLVVLEDRSTSTQQNMAFSREVIEKHASCDVSAMRVGFSTTNYHVFRGYVCAHQAGMAVEGMGSKTRAYFWPNAFLREFAGLLVAQWKSILQAYVIIALFYTAVEYALMFM